MYLLDSDVLISFTRGQHGIQEKMLEVGLQNCLLSEISLAELYVGAYKSNSNKEMGKVNFVASHLTVLSLSSALKTYASIRAKLESEGFRLDNMDLFIAATAIEKDLVLVTHNAKHFSRIPGLKMEDWIC